MWKQIAWLMLGLALASATYGATIILVDNSGSMADRLPGGESKSAEAAMALRFRLLGVVEPQESVSLWAFGGSCSPRLQYTGRPRTPPTLAAADLDRLEDPSGGTPLAISVEHALETLERRPEPRQLIVVTDGLDTCGGDPCAVVRAKARGIRVSVHTVGLGMNSTSGEFRSLQCMADASHEGTARNLGSGEPASGLGGLIDDLSQRLTVPKGELLVRLLDAGGDKQDGVSFVAVSEPSGDEIRGTSGIPLRLPEGRYRVRSGGEDLGSVAIEANRRRMLEQRSTLGRLVIQSRCSERTSFSLLDSADRLLHSGSLTEATALDLPPGRYKAALTQFAHVVPSEVVVKPAQTAKLSLRALSELTVHLDPAADPGNWIEVFDDAQTADNKPVASGPVGQSFPLPVGLYNVRVAGPDAELFRAHANFQVAEPCQSLNLSLERGSALRVDCLEPGSYDIWNDADGSSMTAQFGQTVALEPGLYNLVFPGGQSLPNVRIESSLVQRQCP